MFIGRKKEIEQLNGFYEGENASIAVVSGQIGVGKTSLLKEFAKDKDALFFEAYETTGKHQLELLSKLMGSTKPMDIDGFCQSITKRALKSKQLIIIDQYPYIIKADSEFDKKLHEYFVGEWKDLPIKIILCADHGASRLAVLARKSKFDKRFEGNGNEILSGGRFANAIVTDAKIYPRTIVQDDKII